MTSNIDIKRVTIRKRTSGTELNTYCVHVPKKLIDTGVLSEGEEVNVTISKRGVDNGNLRQEPNAQIC